MRVVSKFAWHEGHPMPSIMVDRFWAKVNKSGQCWLWTGRRFGETHYGAFNLCVMTWRGPAWRPEAAHRLAYELLVGPIPGGLHVLHSCDNRICVRPEHLRLGTDADNKADVVARWRMPRGAEHHMAKLTDAQVVRIRKAYFAGRGTMKQLAHQYGLDFQTVQTLLHGRTWRHAGGPIIPVGVRLQTTLTPTRVTEIRRLHAEGTTMGQLARRFNIAVTHVSRLVHRHPSVWKHVP